MNDNLPTVRLKAKFEALRQSGELDDIKFWYLGAAAKNAPEEELAEEALAILEAYEQKAFIPIPPEKFR